jgi:VWFA-related protein
MRVPRSLRGGLRRARVASLLTLLATAVVGVVVAAQTPQAPVFRAGVELVAVEVQVLGRDGTPIPRLDTTHFEVRIDGRVRRVATANLVDFSASTPPPLGTVLPTVNTDLGPLPVASPFERTFILAFDELSFRVIGGRMASEAAQKFVDRLRPEDLVGLFTYPTMPRSLDLTHRHVSVRQALQRVTSRSERPFSEFKMSPSEVVDITALDRDVFDEVVQRECPPDDLNCPLRVSGEAAQLAGYYEADTARRVMSLRVLLNALSRLPSRKTLVIVSGGMISADRSPGRPDITTMTHQIGKEAAIANTSLYVLHVDSGFFEASGVDRPRGDWVDSFRDTSLFGLGLENVAGAAGGSYHRAQAGTADHVFNRVLSETAAHYLIGVEPSPDDRDGRLHAIRVKVQAKGATVRNRTYVVIPRPRRAN